MLTDAKHEIIRSRSNIKIQNAAKLRQKKYRDQSRAFCFEGRKLTDEALRSKISIKALFYTPSNSDYVDSLIGDFERIPVIESVYEKLTDERSPDGVFCIAEYLDSIKYLDAIKNEKIKDPFIAVSLRDPGNLGALIRSASALGVGTLIISSDCADVYSQKVVRSSMGALFRSEILVVEQIDSVPAALSQMGYSVFAATLHRDSHILTSVSGIDNICYAVGNEGHGIPESFIKNCGGCVTIPMSEGAESLNVTLAASILMWENYKKRL